MKAKHTTNKYSQQLKTHKTNIHQTLLTKGKQTLITLLPTAEYSILSNRSGITHI